MNRINSLFENKKSKILNVYFTAGFPTLNDTSTILKALANSGVDIVEIGMPYSDPVADGETIQVSNQKALNNGMSIRVLLDQLENIRKEGLKIPIVLMGYFNPIYQYGVEEFCEKCKQIGIDGLILPDLPVDEYTLHYKAILEKHGIINIFLITPQTSEERIRTIDSISDGFIYMVSSASVTGATSGINDGMEKYFNRVNAMELKNPRLIGFGIKDKPTFNKACEYASGAIIGSQFIRVIENANDLNAEIKEYIGNILE